jgi:hypothetical protein
MVDAPADRAWAFVADPVAVQWLQAVDSQVIAGRVVLDAGLPIPCHHARRMAVDATHEIIRIEPPRLLETRITSQGTVTRSMVQVEAVGDAACVIIVQGETEWGGSLMAVVSRILTGIAGRSTFHGYLERMKSAIETAAAEPVSAE